MAVYTKYLTSPLGSALSNTTLSNTVTDTVSGFDNNLEKDINFRRKQVESYRNVEISSTRLYSIVGGDLKRWPIADGVNNTNFIIEDTKDKENVRIIAKLPESLSENLTANWDEIGESGIFAKDNVKRVLQTLGISPKFGLNGYRVWTDGSPVKLNIEFEFHAKEDAFHEVYLPSRLLQMIALPTQVGGSGGNVRLYAAPGPSINVTQALKNNIRIGKSLLPSSASYIADTLSKANPFEISATSAINKLSEGSLGRAVNKFRGNDNVNVRIGNIIQLRKVIVESVSVEWGLQINNDGFPLSSKTTVEVTTSFITSVQDIRKNIRDSRRFAKKVRSN